MRVGVFFSRASVRGPARVADAVGAIKRAKPDRFFEVAQFAFGTTYLELVTFVDHGDTRGVVTAILELAQSVDDQRHDLFVTYISNNSTHAVNVPAKVLELRMSNCEFSNCELRISCRGASSKSAI